MATTLTGRTIISGVNPRTMIRGDRVQIVYTLGDDYDLTGKKVFICAKKRRTDPNSSAIIDREVDSIDVGAGSATVVLTPAETGTVGTFFAEIETRNDIDESDPQTALLEEWAIVQDVRQ